MDNNKLITGKISKSEYERLQFWFNERFPNSSFEEFVRKTKLRK